MGSTFNGSVIQYSFGVEKLSPFLRLAFSLPNSGSMAYNMLIVK